MRFDLHVKNLLINYCRKRVTQVIELVPDTIVIILQ